MYLEAEKAHKHIKFHLEYEIKKYAPLIPQVRILQSPPRGKYCNHAYKFCPHLLWGGFCKDMFIRLAAVDGRQFTKITSDQFWDFHRGADGRRIDKPHKVAVGSYKVYKSSCDKSSYDNRNQMRFDDFIHDT